ncbi:MAG: hypothetical protein J6P66_00405, partial [Bacteroidaceae bacterium]|nr:hypothetical protein [Bacteroidaceae bacterium]
MEKTSFARAVDRKKEDMICSDGFDVKNSDVSRGMHVSYDLNGNPVFMAYNAGSETEAGYTTGGQKLWTVHRTAAGTIPADVLSDPNKPKPTPEIGTTPSQ